MDYAWILAYHTVCLLLSCFVNGIPHPSECDSLKRNVQRADSNSRTLDPESHLTGQWLSQECETRPGPIHLLRHYNFYPPHHLSPHRSLKFKLRHYYYSDTGCSEPLYTLSIHGSYRVDRKSWAVTDASEMQYRFHKISIAGYSQTIIDELQHIINESCSGHIFPSWSPHRQYTIFLSNLETDALFSSRAHREFTTAPPIRNKQDICLINVYRMFRDLDLLKIVHRPMNAFDPYDRTKLYLGDLNTPVEERKSHVPTAFQVPLIKSTTIQGCDVCKALLKSSYRDPPSVGKIENLPLFLDGEWISGECETQPLGIFIKRNLYVTLNNFTYESNIYSDSSCTSITMSVKYYGDFYVRQLRDLAGRTTGRNITEKKTSGGERKPLAEIPRKNEGNETFGEDEKTFNVLPMIEMFANTHEVLSQNPLMRQSMVKEDETFVENVYETVQDSDGENDDHLDKSERSASFVKVGRWPKLTLDEQHGTDENDNYLATNNLEESASSLEEIEKPNHSEGSDVDNTDKRLNNDVKMDTSLEKKRESLVGLYEEILNSKLDGEFRKEVVDNLLTSKSRRHKRHNSNHGPREHGKHKHEHIEHDEKSPLSEFQYAGKMRLPTNTWPEILPLAWNNGKPNILLPKVKVNQMNTIDKKDLEQFFVSNIGNQKTSHKESKVSEKPNSRGTKENKQKSSFTNTKSDQSQKQIKSEDSKIIEETISMNTPEKILYWYGRPNLGQVPIVEKIVGETDQFTIPAIALQLATPLIEEPTSQHMNIPSAQLQSSKISEDNNLPKVRPIDESDGDVNRDTNLQNDENSADLNEYLVDFHIESADLKMYDYDLIENLKYDHNCEARFQLWGTIIGDKIPLRSSCLSLGIQLPHFEQTLARIQVSKYNKLTLYLDEPDQSHPPSQFQFLGQSRPISDFQGSFANHNRIVNFRTLPLHKCKLYADDFYLEPGSDIDIVENDKDQGIGNNVKNINKLKDLDDDDEDEYDEPLQTIDSDNVESVADKCDGSRSNVVVIVFCFSVLGLLSKMSSSS